MNGLAVEPNRQNHMLILFFRNRAQTHFSRWTLSKPSSIPQGETRLFVPGFLAISNHTSNLFPSGGTVCVVEEDSIIILVDKDRVLYKLDLQPLNFKEGTLATPEDTSFPYQPYCHRDYLVSSNGCRVVGLYVRCPEWSNATNCESNEEQSASLDFSKIRIGLKSFEFSATTDQVQTLELEYSDPESPDFHSDHAITFSPDLSMLQAGLHVFDLLAPGHPRLSFPDSPLDDLRHGESSFICFSACNCYLIIIEGKGEGAQNELATFGLFRVSPTAGKIEKIAIVGLDDLAADGFCAAFHPVLPLLLLTCITSQGNRLEDVTKFIRVMEIDLEAFKFVQIDLPKHQPFISGVSPK